MKRYIYTTQYIYAGTRYDKQAIQILIDAGFSSEDAQTIIDEVFNRTLRSFKYAPNWLEKYLKGIARLIALDCDGDLSQVETFIEKHAFALESFLYYVRIHRDELGGVAFDDRFVNKMSMSEVYDFVNKIGKERINQLDNIDFRKFSNAQYKLIPIESYQDFHNKFGGLITGDGKDIRTAWCHANSESSWHDYADFCNMPMKVYVLVNPMYKNIHFDAESNANNPLDQYGLSLICIVVRRDTGDFLFLTLRSNHLGRPSAEPMMARGLQKKISNLAGFDVEKAIKKDLELI